MAAEKRNTARRWVTFGQVVSQRVTGAGHFAEVELQPGPGFRVQCRVAHWFPGAYYPLARGMEVVVVFPDADPRNGGLIVGSPGSRPQPPPPQAVAEPDKIWIVTRGDAHIVAKTAVVEADEVHLGEKATEAARAGVVTRDTICPYTNSPHFDASQRVFATKDPPAE